MLSVGASACSRRVPAQILEFSPRSVPVRAGAPVYFALNDALYFNGDGVIDPGGTPIWHGPQRAVSVAPDATHVLVLSGTSLLLLDQGGRVVKELAPANRLFSERPAGQDTYWDATGIQWSADSHSFFVLQRSGKAVGRVALHRYRLGEAEPRLLTRIAHPPRHFVPSDGFYQSDSGDAVYYSLAERDDDSACYRYDLRTGAVTTVHELKGTAEQGALPDAGRIFFNFDPGVLGGRNDAGVGWAWTRSLDGHSHLVTARALEPTADECSVFSYAAGQLKRLLRLRKSAGGYGTPACGVSLDRSYYLPGSAQALVSVDTAQHKGLLVVDTQNGTYGTAPQGLQVFFPVHTGNAAGVRLDYTGPGLDPGLDFERLLPQVQAAR